jgi:hypothetical protein
MSKQQQSRLSQLDDLDASGIPMTAEELAEFIVLIRLELQA